MKRLLALALIISLSAGMCACKSRTGASSSKQEQKGVRENVVVSENPRIQDDSVPSEPESSSEPEPEDEPDDVKAAAEAFMEAVKTGSRDKIQPYVDYNTLLRITQEQSAEWQFSLILPLMEWEILSAEIDGDEAAVSAKITNVDMGVVLPLWLDSVALLVYDNALLDDPLDDDELDAAGRDKFAGLLKEHAGGRIEKLIDIRMTKDGDRWKPQPDNELGDAVLGRYFTAYADKAGHMGQFEDIPYFNPEPEPETP